MWRKVIGLGPTGMQVTALSGGGFALSSSEALQPYPRSMAARLLHWAAVAPERVFIAQREAQGHWREVTYEAAVAEVRSLASALLGRNLGPERPVMFLSGNDIEQALLGLACQYVGIPFVPVSVAYSLIAKDHSKLRSIAELMTPGLIFAASGLSFAAAITAVATDDMDIVVAREPMTERPVIDYGTLRTAAVDPIIDDLHAALSPDGIAKFIMTSGSTGAPKAVINTHGMLSANQQQQTQCLAFLSETPPILVDWLPWSHTFGGNSNLGVALYNGGSFYIDEGRPTPDGIEATLRNLRDIAPTLYYNVPKGFEALITHLRADAALRRNFYSRLQATYFAGASLAPHVQAELDALASEAGGAPRQMLTGLGATETAPFAFWSDGSSRISGHAGIPAPGLAVRLVPVDGKLEARVKGPNITPGYWRQPELTRQAFDSDGFYRLGDALDFADPDDPARGLVFVGRIAEDFKLSSGTWVQVGPLRTTLLKRFGGHANDVVIAGLNREDIRVLILPAIEKCRRLAPGLPNDASVSEVVAHDAVRRFFADAITLGARGSSASVSAAILLTEPPSLEAGEVTDKGSINQRALLSRRAILVDRLYAIDRHPDVIFRLSGLST